MEFEWDEEKRLANLRKHGIDFVDVPAVFEEDIVIVEDARYSYGSSVSSHLDCYKSGSLLLSILSVKNQFGLFLHERRLNMNNEPISSNSQTDWQRLDAMSDQDIDFSDCPEVSPEQFSKAVVRKGLSPAKNKAQVTLQLDRDVLEWFKSHGQDYQDQINALLRAYVEDQRSTK